MINVVIILIICALTFMMVVINLGVSIFHANMTYQEYKIKIFRKKAKQKQEMLREQYGKNEVGEHIEKELVNCICCDKDMIYEGHRGYHSIGMFFSGASGLIFQASGNYGSAVFDPPGAECAIELYVCDKCLIKDQKYLRFIGRDKMPNEFDKFKSREESDTMERSDP